MHRHRANYRYALHTVVCKWRSSERASERASRPGTSLLKPVSMSVCTREHTENKFRPRYSRLVTAFVPRNYVSPYSVSAGTEIRLVHGLANAKRESHGIKHLLLLTKSKSVPRRSRVALSLVVFPFNLLRVTPPLRNPLALLRYKYSEVK